MMRSSSSPTTDYESRSVSGNSLIRFNPLRALQDKSDTGVILMNLASIERQTKHRETAREA